MKTRIYFLDHLRTFAIFLVVLIHAGIVYEPILENIWLVSDPVKNGSIGLIRMYADLFVMYTLFFISGYFIPMSLKDKGNWEFIKSKIKRILIPWLIAVLTLIPAYKMIFLYTRGLPQEEWYSYFHIFQRSGADLGFFSNNPSQNWLWFLPVLFVFQMLYLVYAKSRFSKIKITLKTAVLLTLIIGLIYSMFISNADLTGWHHSGFLEFQRERLLPYFMVFLLGSLAYKVKLFDASKNTRNYILANVILTVGLAVFTVVALNLFFNLIDPGRNYFFISDFVDRTVYYLTALLSMFSFLYILLHSFKFKLNKTNSLMNLLNKNSYAVYIIHVIVIGLLAWLMLPFGMPAFVKYLLLTVLSFIVSNLLVLLYGKVFQNRPSLKWLALSAGLIGLFLATSSSPLARVDNKSKNLSERETSTSLHIGLHEAVLTGNLVAVEKHIKAGSNLNEIEKTGGSTPLITAAVFGKYEIADALIKAGADLNVQNFDGSTALHSAAFFCQNDIVESLLANGADLEIKNKFGSTALEGVIGPFQEVEGVYQHFQKTLGPLGLELNIEELEEKRTEVADIFKQFNENKE